MSKTHIYPRFFLFNEKKKILSTKQIIVPIQLQQYLAQFNKNMPTIILWVNLILLFFDCEFLNKCSINVLKVYGKVYIYIYNLSCFFLIQQGLLKKKSNHCLICAHEKVDNLMRANISDSFIALKLDYMQLPSTNAN